MLSIFLWIACLSSLSLSLYIYIYIPFFRLDDVPLPFVHFVFSRFFTFIFHTTDFKYSRFPVLLGYDRDRPFSARQWCNSQLRMPPSWYSSSSQSREVEVNPLVLLAVVVLVLVGAAVVVGVVSPVEPVHRYWHPSWQMMPLSKQVARLIKT
jgi:hypothetical protein